MEMQAVRAEARCIACMTSFWSDYDTCKYWQCFLIQLEHKPIMSRYRFSRQA